MCTAILGSQLFNKPYTNLVAGGGGGIRLRAVISRNLGVNSTFYSIPSVTSKDHGRDSHIGSLEHI